MGAACNYCPTLIRSENSTRSMLTASGALYQHGLPIKWDAVVAEGEVLTDLPVYPWNHSASHWYESRIAKGWRSRRFGHHELLGQRSYLEGVMAQNWIINECIVCYLM
jgi:acyl transferase domain-containing protein